MFEPSEAATYRSRSSTSRSGSESCDLSVHSLTPEGNIDDTANIAESDLTNGELTRNLHWHVIKLYGLLWETPDHTTDELLTHITRLA